MTMLSMQHLLPQWLGATWLL